MSDAPAVSLTKVRRLWNHVVVSEGCQASSDSPRSGTACVLANHSPWQHHLFCCAEGVLIALCEPVVDRDQRFKRWCDRHEVILGLAVS